MTAAIPATESPIVFVVDDDVSVRESLEALIQTVGWETRTFASAQDFLNCPPSRGPSCLVLDVSLPDEEIERRVAAYEPPAPRYASGVMAKYARMVSSASAGAITG